MQPAIKQFTNGKKLDSELCKLLRDIINSSIVDKGYSSIAISGGQTPLNLYKLLSKEKIDWTKVFISIVDERCVTDEENSNMRNIKESFNFSEDNHPQLFGHLYKIKKDKATLIGKRIRAPLPFDFVLLGMGEDGHIASIFPNQEDTSLLLSSDCDHEILLVKTNDLFKRRVTFTLPAITNTKLIILILKGRSKIEALQRAINYDIEDINMMPVRALFLQDNILIRIFQSNEK